MKNTRPRIIIALNGPFNGSIQRSNRRPGKATIPTEKATSLVARQTKAALLPEGSSSSSEPVIRSITAPAPEPSSSISTRSTPKGPSSLLAISGPVPSHTQISVRPRQADRTSDPPSSETQPPAHSPASVAPTARPPSASGPRNSFGFLVPNSLQHRARPRSFINRYKSFSPPNHSVEAFRNARIVGS